MSGTPSEWPENHRWVSFQDEGLLHEVNCRKCLQVWSTYRKVEGDRCKEEPMTLRQSIYIVLGALALILLFLIGWQPFKVWSAKLDGEAKFAEAEYSRRVTVLEAQAKLDSASKLADAEVARARGVAQANLIIGNSLRGNESYLKYLWINQLENNKNSVIYVPTETNLPILEAQRLSNLPAPEAPPQPEAQPSSPAH